MLSQNKIHEIENDYRYYKKVEKILVKLGYEGKCAVVHNGKLHGIRETLSEAFDLYKERYDGFPNVVCEIGLHVDGGPLDLFPFD